MASADGSLYEGGSGEDKKSIHSLARQFSDFLHIKPRDIEVMQAYQGRLTVGAAAFAEIFYDYLFAYKPTAEVLEKFKQGGGDIHALVDSQIQHLLKLLAADTSTDYVASQLKVGQIHFRHGIEPVWIMGGYHLYLEHLRGIIHGADSQISPQDRLALESAICKFLYRDIGLMLQGYWDSALDQLHGETQKITELQEQVSSLLSNLPQVLWSVDVVNNCPLYISPTTRDICSIEMEMPIPCLAWTIAEDRHRVEEAWQRALGGQKVEIETRVIVPGEDPRWFRREFHPYRDDTGQVVRVDGIMEDTTEAHQAMRRMEHLANTDMLTGLANRACWYDRLTHALAAARRSGQQLVLMLLDLNYFKMINDTLGHPAGDDILKQVANRMQEVIRDSDTLARLGGDEFSVLLSEVDDPVAASVSVANKILGCFRKAFRVEDNDELYLGASIGIALFPDHGEDADTLLSHADIAMYAAKRGDTDYTFFDPGADETTSQQLQLSSWLRRSMERDELALHYQPKVNMETGGVCGVEALLRWQHPSEGMIPPDQFIPVAEQNGMITPITDWVLHSALSQAYKWRKAGLASSVAVNISARSFQNPKLVERIKQALALANVPGDCLEVEITENILMTDLERGNDIIRHLNDLGVRISIDDFGTGYSSLSYLKRLPIHTIKIDKSFVLDMMESDNDAVIVRSIIDLGQRLGLEVIAEGVENQQVWNQLKEWGCNTVQGFHISHPVSHENMSEWLSDNRCH